MQEMAKIKRKRLEANVIHRVVLERVRLVALNTVIFTYFSFSTHFCSKELIYHANYKSWKPKQNLHWALLEMPLTRQ
jgi:hypothetical protein